MGDFSIKPFRRLVYFGSKKQWTYKIRHLSTFKGSLNLRKLSDFDELSRIEWSGNFFENTFRLFTWKCISIFVCVGLEMYRKISSFRLSFLHAVVDIWKVESSVIRLAGLCFRFWPFAPTKQINYPINIVAEVSSKFCQILKNPSKSCPRLYKWRNFAKSGHAESAPTIWRQLNNIQKCFTWKEV